MGSKNKVGLKEAFDDKDKKGFAWNNLMLQRWVDHHGAEHRVLDDYERNRVLVDLSAQPEEVKSKILGTIQGNSVPLDRPMIGAQFLKFCGKYDLVKMSEYATQYTAWLEAPYPTKE